MIYTLIYLILAILVLLPIIVSMAFLLKSDIDLSITKAYGLEFILLLIVTAISHFYYHQVYGLNYFPTWVYTRFFLIASIGGVVVTLLVQLFLHWFKKKEIMSFQLYILFFIGIIVFFMQKYVYIDRLDDVEAMFDKGDPDKVTEEGDIKVGLVASEQNKVLRPPYSQTKYNNYVYLKNNKDSSFIGDVYLFIDTKYHSDWELKMLEDIKVGAQATQLLMMLGENKRMSGKWDQRSFITDHQVIDIKTKIVSE